jgi:hypothetical protein
VTRLSERSVHVGLFAVVVVPLVVAVVALHQDRWYPVLDLAMTEVRVRQVGGGDTPLIGLPGRIGDLPDQGSHPGPLSFWLLGPAYRLFGSSPWALEVGTVVIHMVVVAIALWVGRRLAGRTGMVLVAVVLAVAMRGYGTLLLVQPWNPYLPLLAWLLVLFATWAVFAGDHRWLLAVTVAGSLCAQTHVPYLLLAGASFFAAAAVVAVRAVRGDDDTRHAGIRTLGLSAVVGVALWLPPIVQELQGGDGNISRLVRYFRSPPESPIGARAGMRLLARHLNVVDAFGGLVHGDQRFMYVGLDDQSSVTQGVVVGFLWLAAAVASFTVLRSTKLRALHAVIALTLVLSLASMARIFGFTWYYLTLWAWGITALVIVAVCWTAISLVGLARREWRPAMRQGAVAVAMVTLVASTVMFTVDATNAEHAEADLGTQMGEMVAPTYDAVIERTGAATGEDGRYLVQGSDAHFFGSQVFGFINELDRRGLDVGGERYFTVPNTPELTMPTDLATAEIHYATGAYIDRWRDVPEAVEVASNDSRTADERARYARLRREALAGLRRDGLDDLVPMLDYNVFGLSTSDEISRDTRVATSLMLQIGTEAAVFVIPVGTRLPPL